MVVTAAPAKSDRYYLEQVAPERHDYYAGHGEAPGVWTGELAARLGITGQVTPEAFQAVLAETHPDTGERLKPRRNTKVSAWDLTFSPPKSFSTLWAIAPPQVRETLRQAHLAAVQVGVRYLEEHACVARLGRQGADAQPGTGFIAAAFTHRTSREADPQLHTHVLAANLTEAADGRRAALDGALFYPQRFAADAVYQTALRAEATRHLGLRYVERDGAWEVDGVPPGLSRQFSKRRAQIEHELAARGTSGARAAQAAALATRRAKADIAPDGELLHDRFTREARQAGHQPEQVLLNTLHRHPTDPAHEQQAGPEREGSGLGRLPYAPDPTPPIDADDRADRLHALARRAARQRAANSPAAAELFGEGEVEQAVIEALVGPEGLTEKASSFARRDILTLAAHHLPHHAQIPVDHAGGARQLLERIADRVLADPRVIPLLDPQARTSGEVIRPRDADGNILREVRTHTERRYSTVDLLAAEHELLTRAQHRQTAGSAVIDEDLVAQTLAAFPDLDADQQAMVRTVATSGAGVDVVVGKAGTGKTTAMRAYAHAARAAGLQVLGVAPSATAAHQLQTSAGIEACTVDLLLIEAEHGRRRLPAGAVVIVDEAAMVDTRNRLALQRLVDDAGGKLIDVGDHRQIPSVDVGGFHHVLATHLGAVTLGVNHRFRDPGYRDAADLIRDGHADKGIAQLRALGAVTEHDEPADGWTATITDWARLTAEGADVRMLATERAVVARLNRLARHQLIAQGSIAPRGRTYVADDDSREIELAAGDRIRLGRNNARLPQPDGTTATVRNGMTGTVTRTGRRHLVITVDPDHHGPGTPAQLTLPAGYAGEHVDYGWASTADAAQGATCDHSLFVPSPATSAERAYVALSRGRESNRIYAAAGTGWEQAIAASRAHIPAHLQHPDHPHWNHLHPPQATPQATPGPQPADPTAADSSQPLRERMAHRTARPSQPGQAADAAERPAAPAQRAHGQRVRREEPRAEPTAEPAAPARERRPEPVPEQSQRRRPSPQRPTPERGGPELSL